jgi:hypothetical protein
MAGKECHVKEVATKGEEEEREEMKERYMGYPHTPWAIGST